MKTRNLTNRMKLTMVLAALLLVGSTGAIMVTADPPVASTELGVQSSPVAVLPVAGQPDEPTAPHPMLQAAPAATDGAAGVPVVEREAVVGAAPDDNVGLASPNPRLSFSYYLASGATMRGRSSATTHVYDGLGCVHLTSGAEIVNTELYIPDGSIIKYLRLYYIDTSASGSVKGYITRYTPGTATNDLVNISSSTSGAGGYGFVVSDEITETVNNTSYAYTLIGWPTAAASSLQICGLRVAYYAPTSVASFLPIIDKNRSGP